MFFFSARSELTDRRTDFLPPPVTSHTRVFEPNLWVSSLLPVVGTHYPIDAISRNQSLKHRRKPKTILEYFNKESQSIRYKKIRLPRKKEVICFFIRYTMKIISSAVLAVSSLPIAAAFSPQLSQKLSSTRLNLVPLGPETPVEIVNGMKQKDHMGLYEIDLNS